MGWTFKLARLDGRGGEEPIHPDLPLTDVKLTHVLSGSTVLTGSVPLTVGGRVDEKGRPLFEPWASIIYAELDGVLRGCGIVDQSVDDGKGKLALSCVGFSAYLRGLPFAGAFSGYDVDALAVARSLWDHAQGQVQGNLGVRMVGASSSLGRVGHRARAGVQGSQDQPYVVSWWQTPDLLAEFQKLAKAAPFDYMERVAWSGPGVVDRSIEFGTPTLGRKREDLRFVLGENIRVKPRVTLAGAKFASEVWVHGAGEGSAMVHSRVANHAGDRLRRVKIVQAKSVTDTETCSTLARQEVRVRSGSFQFGELEVQPGPGCQYGDVSPGDWIFVQLPESWLEVSSWVRVLEVGVEPSKGGVFTLRVYMEEAV